MIQDFRRATALRDSSRTGNCDTGVGVAVGLGPDHGRPAFSSQGDVACSRSELPRYDDDAAVSFLSEFRTRHGRAPRILHVGNIANNAYVNAKLLNEIGFDCDVLCHDYYHIMGCPEWEEVEFSGDIGDPFFPRWWAVDLKGYRRPRWFAQGPFQACVSYLIARRSGKRRTAGIKWAWLAYERFRACSHGAGGTPADAWTSCRIGAERSVRYFAKSMKQFVEAARIFLSSLAKGIDAIASLTASLVIAMVLCLQAPLLLVGKPIWTPSRLRSVRAARQATSKTLTVSVDSAQLLVDEFRSRFPSRVPQLTTGDVAPFIARAAEMATLFRHYDIVHCYSTDPIYGMLTDVRYVAFEHGTIREIPFEDSSVGRMTLLAYAKAAAVVLTNADNLIRAKVIRTDWAKIIPGLHRFDERPIERIVAGLDACPAPAERFGFDHGIRVLFAPARHAHAVKGNDKVIDAIAIAWKRYPGRFKVVFVEWGDDLQASKSRIAALGISAAVHWVAPLDAKALVKVYAAVDCVIDQFLLPCFGGVPIDVMVVGRCPVMTYIDDDLMKEYYGEALPVLNCHAVEEISNALGVVVEDPARCACIAREARRWMSEHHTHRHVVNWLSQAYRLTGVLETKASDP